MFAASFSYFHPNIKLFIVIIVAVYNELECLPVFAVKARSLLLEWSPIKGSTVVGSTLVGFTCKNLTRAKVTDIDKCSSITEYQINYSHERM
jgi:hypothetical protein